MTNQANLFDCGSPREFDQWGWAMVTDTMWVHKTGWIVQHTDFRMNPMTRQLDVGRYLLVDPGGREVMAPNGQLFFTAVMAHAAVVHFNQGSLIQWHDFVADHWRIMMPGLDPMPSLAELSRACVQARIRISGFPIVS